MINETETFIGLNATKTQAQKSIDLSQMLGRLTACSQGSLTPEGVVPTLIWNHYSFYVGTKADLTKAEALFAATINLSN